MINDDKAIRTEIAVIEKLPVSFMPPVVEIIPKLAQNDEEIQKSADASNISVSRAFEKHINYALSILGHETQILGQGSAMNPDGIAFDVKITT